MLKMLADFLIWPARLAAWGGLAYVCWLLFTEFNLLQGPLGRLGGGETLQWWLSWGTLLACSLGLSWAFARICLLSQNPAVALQWYVLHLLGIIAGDRSIYLREHHPILAVVLFLTGFIDTTLLLLAIFWLTRLARRTLRKLSSPQKQTA